MVVNQWVPAAHKGDAIGDSARRMRSLLRAMGHDSDIFALTIDDDLRHDVLPFSDSASKRADVTLFHFALPSPMSEAFRGAAPWAGLAISQRHPGEVLCAVRAGSLPSGVDCAR